MADLFVEVFPIETAALSPLSAYQLHVAPAPPAGALKRVGGQVARRFRRAFAGMWWWHDDEGRILSDTERSAIELNITLDILKTEDPAFFSAVQEVRLDAAWQPTAPVLAEYALRHPLKALDAEMSAALKALETRLKDAHIEREHKLRAWVVDGQPAVSLSVASRLIYDRTLQQVAGAQRDHTTLNEQWADLRVWARHYGLRGVFSHIVGPLADHRERLLAAALNDEVRHLLLNAMDGEWVVMVKAGQDEYEYLASMLNPIIRLDDLSRFDLDRKQATQVLQMTPALRAAHVKALSDVAKAAGVLTNAYNARSHPALFFSADFEMNLRFDSNRVRPYKPGTLAYDFSHCGIYALRPKLEAEALKVCVVNTLTFKIEDFVEAMQRYLKRHFSFQVQVIRERQVRVVSRPNLESAVRVVEKENPDIILAFFPDESGDNDDDESDMEATANYMKSLTLGRGIPTHIIHQSTLDDPDAMPFILLTVLGKTGSSPFVLAEPLEHTDYVVGLDVVRDRVKTTGETQLTAIARVYAADGTFSHYAIRHVTIEGDTLPYVLIRDLFPQRLFAKKRVVLHHDGPFPADLLAALSGWGRAIGTAFYPVEIVRFGAPRIYALETGIAQPPWGSAFKLSATQALLVSSLPNDDITPQPLHVRTVSAAPTPALPIEEALRGILVWTLLAYGGERLPKLPVTTLNAEQMAYWLRKGGKFSADEGEMPFWL